VLILGAAPVLEDDLLGKPFQGRAGLLLRSVLQELGIPARIELFARCRPEGQRNPTADEMTACSEFLKAALAGMPSLEYVVPLGPVAFRASGLKGTMSDLQGQVIEGQLHGRSVKFFPLHHPDYVIKNRHYASTWESHWQGLSVLLGLKSVDPVDVRDHSYPDIPGALPALDLETSGLDPEKEDILAWTLRRGSGPVTRKVDSPDALQELGRIYRTEDFAVHGAHFEGSWGDHALGAPGRIRHDTLLLSRRLDPTEPAELGATTARHVQSLSGYKSASAGGMASPRDLPSEELLRRNRLDAEACYQLGPILKTKLAETQGLRGPGADALYQEDVELARTVARIQRLGLPMDPDRLMTIRQEHSVRQADARQRASDALGCDLNPGSVPQVQNAIASILGDPTRSKDSTDELSLRVLAQHLSTHPKLPKFIDAVLDYRASTKVSGTYVVGYAKLRSPDGRLRTDLRWPGTVSWRCASDNPNLQNVPRQGFRHVFKAQPGWVLLEADLAQAELRIAAALSQEPVLCKLFREGADPHGALAQTIFGPGYTKEERVRAKTTNFGLLYGAGWKTLWQQFAKDGIFLPSNEVRGYHQTFWKLYTRLGEYVDEKMRCLHAGERVYAPEASYSWSLGELLLRTPDDPEEAARAAFNATIQSVPPRLTLRLARRLQSAGVRVVLQTHDGLLCEVRETESVDVGRRLRVMMREETQADWWNGVPCPIDLKSGESWGEMKELLC
jgi:uracil-DNA glycosylase family 4